jgi:hypothetical protein
VRGRIQSGGAHPLEPIDCTVANNLVQGDGIVEAAGRGTRFLGNIVSGGPARDGREVRVEDNLALVQVGDLWKLGAGSPAVDASAAGFDYVTEDIDGQRRDHPDVGADELSNGPVAHRPLVEADVGIDAP